jgi:hypothetical protein
LPLPGLRVQSPTHHGGKQGSLSAEQSFEMPGASLVTITFQ